MPRFEVGYRARGRRWRVGIPWSWVAMGIAMVALVVGVWAWMGVLLDRAAMGH